jgi:putative membrane protein
VKPFAVATAALAFVVALTSSSSSFAQERQPQSPSASKPPASQSAPAAPLSAREFVSQLGIAGLAEVQLGQMASERAANADVKAFGQMMVKDHSQANKDLSQVAMQLNIPMPTQIDQKHKDLSDRLSKLQGAAFDREYMNAMVQGHQEVLGKLRAQSGTHPAGHEAQKDQALTQWVAKATPVVQQHLDRAMEVQSKVK